MEYRYRHTTYRRALIEHVGRPRVSAAVPTLPAWLPTLCASLPRLRAWLPTPCAWLPTLCASLLTLPALFLTLAASLLPSQSAVAQLSGEYTVGNGGDFATISEAVETLNDVGRAGPITFNILDGSYEEQFVISTHDGMSEGNPVVFQPESGNLGDVKIAFEATSSSGNYVARIENASFIAFRKILFSALGSDFGTIISLPGGSHSDISILDNHFEGADVQSSQQQFSIIHSTAGLAVNTVISGNTFQRGSHSIYINSGSSGSGTSITNNTSSGAGGDAVYLMKQFAPVVAGNSITHSGNFYALRIEQCDNALKVLKNRIDVSGASRNGIYLRLSEGGSLLEEQRGLIANNFFTVRNFDSGRNAIYVVQSKHQDILYNSVNVVNPNPNSQALHLSGDLNVDIRILNNSFSNTGHSFQTHLSGGYAIRVDDPGAVTEMDYNNIFSTGNYVARWGLLDIANLVDLQVLGNEGRNANSISVLPHYVSAVDLHTQSPWMAQRATPSARVADDIDGQPRDDNAPTIGAAEFDFAVEEPMNGTYTIGSGGDYSSFTEAVNDLQLRGMTSDVTFDVLPGIYDEQLTLFEVPTLNAFDRITFRSQTGDASDVTLHYESVSDQDNFVINLRSAKNVTFEHLTMASNTSSTGSRSRIVVIQGYTESIWLRDNVFHGTSSTNSGSPNHAIIHAEPALTNGISILFNRFNGGGYAAYLIGRNQSALSRETVVTDNEVSSSGYMAFRLHFQHLPVIRRNVIAPGVQGMYLQDVLIGLIAENRINVNGLSSGITLFRCEGGDGPLERFLIANNFITHRGGNNSIEAGIEIIDSRQIDVVYNSVNSLGPLSPGLYLRHQDASSGNTNVLNNVFSNTGGGYAYQIFDPAAISQSDHNDLYTTGEKFVHWDGDVGTLEDLQQVVGTDLNSISVDPEFVSATDLHARAAALDSAATPLQNVTADIDGEQRDTDFPDIGADEFVFEPGVPVALSTPALVDPSNGSENVPTLPRLRWSGVEGASSYSVEIATDGSFDSPAVGLTAVPSTDVLLESSLVAESEYFWRVRALGEAGVSEWSEVAAFRTGSPASRVLECEADHLIVSDDDSGVEIEFGEICSGEVVVTHVDGTPAIPNSFVDVIPRRWIIEARGLGAFTASICFDLSAVADLVEDKTLVRILSRGNGGAEWAALETEWQEASQRACTHGVSSFSEFVVVLPAEQVSTQSDDLPEVYQLHANYPNPFNPSTTIRFSTARPGDVKLTVIDVLGREVAVLVDGPTAAGRHEVTWNASTAASGVYLYQMQAEGFTRTRRMTLVR